MRTRYPPGWGLSPDVEPERSNAGVTIRAPVRTTSFEGSVANANRSACLDLAAIGQVGEQCQLRHGTAEIAVPGKG